MEILECYLTRNGCFQGTTVGVPVGVLWHDTGAANPTLKRYVQPTPGTADYDRLLRLIGKNVYDNDWNRLSCRLGVNAFVGKLADGAVAAVQTMPWNYRPWACGSGKYGSCNGSPNVPNSPFWIQFELCDDGYRDRAYFETVYRKGVELTAALCRRFGFDPFGTVRYQGVNVPVILCHREAHELGLGSNHGDVLTWFDKFGKTMDDVRRDVAAILENEVEIDMTKDELNRLIDERAAVIADRKVQAALAAVPELAERQVTASVGPWIERIGDIPHASVRREVRALLDCGAINGGTDAAVDPDDIRLPYNEVRTLVMAKRYTDFKSGLIELTVDS